MEQLIAIGYIRKPHGIKGELRAEVDTPFLDAFLDARVLFVEQRGGQVPFFVEYIREGNILLVKLEDLHTREAAGALAGKALFMRASDLPATASPEEEGEGFDIFRLEGYTLKDEATGVVGVIEEVVELPQQFMAVVDYRGREVFVPLHPDLITAVDDDARTLDMTLPEGLLDLYQS